MTDHDYKLLLGEIQYFTPNKVAKLMGNNQVPWQILQVYYGEEVHDNDSDNKRVDVIRKQQMRSNTKIFKALLQNLISFNGNHRFSSLEFSFTP